MHSPHIKAIPGRALNPESSRCDSANRCAAKVISNNVSSLPPFALLLITTMSAELCHLIVMCIITQPVLLYFLGVSK